MQVQLYVGNTMNLLLSGLQFEGGAYINDGVVTVTILDQDEEQVTGETWPLTIDYVTDSSGNYLGVLSSAIDLVKNGRYTVEVEAIKAGNRGFWRQPVVAVERRFA